MRHPAPPAALLLVACAAAAGAAHAGPLADPTRPPAALSAPGGLAAAALPHKANLDTARAIAAAARAAAEPPPAPPAPAVVQGVQLPAGGPATALVDGRPVKVGDRLDGREVLAIDAQGLLVKGGRGPERLWLLSGTGKQAAGSIGASQWARYQPADAPGLDGQAAGSAANPPSSTAPNAATSATPGAMPSAPPSKTTSAMPTATPVSLAGRTTP